jgi:FtsH-binding integral membrane protein
MSTRYLTNLTLAVAGGFLVVASQAFSQPAFEWIAFGIGVLAVMLSAGVFLSGRGRVQRGLDLLTATLGAWTIVETLIFTATTNTWLGFSSGAAFVAIALVGLTAHELSTERVVHSLEVSDSLRPEREYAHTV